MRARSFLAALGGLVLAAVAAGLGGPLADARIAFPLGYGLAAVAWLVALRSAEGLPDARWVRVAVVGGAIALRAALVLAPTELSDDVDRLVWEGGLVLEGKSPYAAAPDSPERAAERERWAAVYARMNHTDVPAAYPPLAQLACAAVVGAAGGPAAGEGRRAAAALRVALALADLAVLLPLAALLRRRGLGFARAVAWAWCPLVVLEFAGGAHLDALGILLLVSALALAVPSGDGASGGAPARPGLAIVAAALGGMAKLLPAALVPFLARAHPRPARAWALAAGAALATALPLVLLEGGARGALAGLGEYAFRWEASPLVHRLVQSPLEAFLPADESWSDPRRLARAVAALAWGGLAVLAWRRRLDPVASARLLVGGFLVLTPTLHPWYVAWFVPFLALGRSAAFSWLVAAAALLYAPVPGYRAGAGWHEPGWLVPAVALPFFALLAVDLLRRPRSA